MGFIKGPDFPTGGMIIQDTDGDSLRSGWSVGHVVAIANGTVTNQPQNRSVLFLPDPGFVGEARFSYTLEDGDGGSSSAEVTVVLGKAWQNPVEHMDINKVAFTGSTETGRHVMRSAADTIKRVTLELGGNDPAIVLPDVDAKAIAPQLFWAAFQNNAQFCNATKRLYIHEDVYDEVRDALVEFIASNIKVGDGTEQDTDLGPIQNSMQYGKVQDYFADCHSNGYQFAIGGDIDENATG